MAGVKRAILIGLGILTAGAIALTARGGKAAGPSGPKNITTIGSELGAIALGAQIVAGGTWVIVASDDAHRQAVVEVVRRHAQEHPGWTYVLFEMDLARELAAERATVEIPASAWGGVAAVKDGELVNHAFFGADDAIVTAEDRITHVERMVPQLGAGVQPSIAAGLLVRVDSGPPVPGVGSGPTAPASRSPRQRWLRRLMGR